MIQMPVEPPVTEYLFRKATRQRIPLGGTFELTPVCNMDCRMCYVKMSRQQQQAIRPLMTAGEWLHLAEEAKNQGMLYLLLTGGEPFSRPDFREIMTGLHDMGLVLTINSNGTLITEKTMEWLVQVPPVRINITLYGASDATYERLCGNPKGFTQVTKAIRMLRDAGIAVKINCSLTPYNADDLEKIIDFSRREELVVQATAYMFPPVRRDASKVGQNDRFAPEEAAYYAAKIEKLLGGSEQFLKRAETLDFGSIPSDDDMCPDAEGDGILCRAGKSNFWVTWDGKMLPCGMLPDEGVDLSTTGFAEAWKQITENVSAIRLPAKCRSCSLKERCRVCAAMAVTETGHYDQVPEYRCRMAQEYQNAFLKIVDEIKGEMTDEA